MRFQTHEFLIRVKENSETLEQIAVKTRRKLVIKVWAGDFYRTLL